jgi:GDP-D-mannose dehydratase
VFRELDLDWTQHVTEDARLVRKQAKRNLQGNAARLRATGWQPATGFAQMIRIMVAEGLQAYGN